MHPSAILPSPLHLIQITIAGLTGIHGVEGIENVDLSNIIKTSHRNYKDPLTACLLCTGMRTASYGKPRRGTEGQRVHVHGKGFGILRYLGECSDCGNSNSIDEQPAQQ